MDTPEQPSTPASSTPPAAAGTVRRISREGVVGTGITVAAIGVLFLLLGWAQWMRLERNAAIILLLIGAVLLIAGAVTTMFAPAEKQSRGSSATTDAS